MKKLLVLFSVLWISAAVSAQSEIKNDSLTLSMGQNKMFGDFILDGSLFTMAVKQLPSFADLLKTAPSMDGLLQSINQPARWVFGKASADGRPTLLYTNRMDNFYSVNENIGVASYQITDKIRLNLSGQYNADGTKIRGNNLLPWDKNYFKGAMEMKFNKNFGVRIEVQRGGNNPYLY